MNNTSYDLERGLAYGVSQDVFAKIKRIETAHLKMLAVPTWTCAPYQDGIVPRFGSHVAWSESNAIVFVQIEVDPLLVSGPIICKHFYGETIPVVTLNNKKFQLLKTGLHAVVDGSKSEIVLSG